MTNTTAPATATMVARFVDPDKVIVSPRNGLPSFTRNDFGVIVDTFGDVANAQQCITVNVTAHTTDNEGFVEQEIIRLTVPLTGAVKPMIESYIDFALPSYKLHDWCVWSDEFEQVVEPF
ncbi:MAG: hypothetical protein F6K11_26895 [Leptolyngbya sp. SIO3F4]|nr:hypothetical protein [Leptolyngbya sp. SIO3F4]